MSLEDYQQVEYDYEDVLALGKSLWWHDINTTHMYMREFFDCGVSEEDLAFLEDEGLKVEVETLAWIFSQILRTDTSD